MLSVIYDPGKDLYWPVYQEIFFFDSVRRGERRYIVAFDVAKLQPLLFCGVISVHLDLALYTLDCFLSRLYITLTWPALSVGYSSQFSDNTTLN